MKLYDTNHVYECEVPELEGTGLILGLKVVPPKEFDKMSNEFRGLSIEGITEKTNEMVISKIEFVKGYELDDGTKITTGKELYERGIPDVWRFVQIAVFEAKHLCKAEIKNS